MLTAAQRKKRDSPVAKKVGTLSPFQLFVVCLITCIAVASVYWTQVVLAEVGVAFDVSAAQARLAFSACSIAYAISFFLFAPFADRISARKLAQFGLCATAIAVGASATVNSFNVYLGIVTLQGGLAAAVPAATFALMPRIAEKDTLGSYFGLVIASTVIGISVGRAAMGFLTTSFNFHGALLICTIAFFLVAILTLVLPKDGIVDAKRTNGVFKMYLETTRILISPMRFGLFLVGFMLFFGYLGTVTFLTLRLQEAPFSLSGSTIGIISLVGLSAVLGAPISGRIIPRFGSLSVALAGLVCVFLAIACFALAQSVIAVSAGMFLVFFGVFACQPAMLVRLTERVKPENKGGASSLYLLTCLAAGSLASAALGPVWLNYRWQGIVIICGLAISLSIVILLLDACCAEKCRGA